MKCNLPLSFLIQAGTRSNHDDGAPTHTAKLTRDLNHLIATDCSEVISKDEWPPNLSPVDQLPLSGELHVCLS